MKIGNTPGAAGAGPLNGTSTTGTSNTAAKGTTGSGATGESSKVTLSSAANMLFDGTVDGTFDEEKVARIRQSIADGTYTVNHGAIADKLIANAQELLGKVSNH